MKRLPRSAMVLSFVLLLLSLPALGAAPAAVPLDPRVLKALIASDYAALAGDARAAAAFGLEAAQHSADLAVAERAATDALQAGDAALVRAAFARWAAVQPDSSRRDALALRFVMLEGDAEEGLALALRLLQADAVGPVAAALSADYPDGGVIARAVLRQLLESPAVPARIEVWLALAGAAQRRGDRRLQGQWVDALVLRFPADPRAGLLRAERLAQTGRRDEARSQVRRVLAQPQLSADQRRIAAEALAVLGDPVGAAQSLAAGPQDSRSLGLRAGWLARAGQLDALRSLYAEAEVRAAMAVADADAPALHLLLGGLAEQLQDWPAAERWYARLAQGEAGQRARLRLGVVLARQGRWPEAQGLLHALQRDDAVDGAVRRDAFLAEADQLEAEAELRAVLERDPADPKALRALGSLLLDQERAAEARLLLAESWQIDPGGPTAAAWGEALWRLERRDEAIAAWAAGRQHDPTDPVLLDTLRRFGQ